MPNPPRYIVPTPSREFLEWCRVNSIPATEITATSFDAYTEPNGSMWATGIVLTDKGEQQVTWPVSSLPPPLLTRPSRSSCPSDALRVN